MLASASELISSRDKYTAMLSRLILDLEPKCYIIHLVISINAI